MINPITKLYIEIYQEAWADFMAASWWNILWRSANVGRAYSLLLEAKENARQLTKL